MRAIPAWTALVAILLVTGCSSGGSGNTSDDDDDDDGGTPTWAPIMTAEWTLQPTSEATNDLHFVTLDRDYYVGGIRPIAPLGTHHTVLALGSPTNIIFASGVGPTEVMFPAGVGLHLTAGTQL